MSSERARSGKPSGGPQPPAAPGWLRRERRTRRTSRALTVSVERELRFEQAQLRLETSMECSCFALQLLPQRRSPIAAASSVPRALSA